MAGSLSQYWKKRDFGVTSEPRGKVARAGKALSFVIQKHAASRLHYDFRLELGGTLVSWAVPKGPSLDPKVRRMAVHVEDHPLSYASFEGVIPKGQYGAGTVIVWDRGTWEPVGDPHAGYKAGKLKFDMHGEKLRGRWNLVRMHGREGERQEPWLLIKENDEEARPAAEYDIVEEVPDSVLKGTAGPAKKPARRAASKKAAKRAASKGVDVSAIPAQAVKAKLPLALAPQLATLVDAPPKGEGWLYEVKFDGYRIVARIEGDDVRLFTRNGNNWTSRMPVVRDELAKLGLASAWLDGEVVVLDAKGNPSFQLLQNAFDSSKTRDMVFFVFDLPHFGGYDLTRVPLVERRKVLEAALAPVATNHVRYSETFDAPVEQLLEGACRKGLEGLIGKRADAPYTSRRSSAWVKVKCSRRQEFVIAGYTDPRGSRTGFGSLLLGVHDEKGELIYAGNVGTGFDQAGLASLFAKLEALATDKMPFATKPKGVKAHWVRPKLVAEVAFSEWTSDGRVRHPVFHGLRTDKEPRAITREPVKHVEAKDEGGNPAARASPAKRGNRNVPMRSPAKATGARITNPERVIDAQSGLRKIDLVEYYGKVAKHILPHLAGRPLAFVRAPEGIAGELFFQKHEMRDKAPLAITTAEELLGAAQMNMIELHTGNATAPDLDHPDRVVFDLDPGEGVSWATLKEATRLTRHVLDLLGLESWLKTSGGKGLHVVVPLKPERTHEEVRDFSEQVVVHMAKTLPKLFVAKSGARNRVGRIFVDYLRNGTTATTAAAFTARARPGLGVSVPLAWRELAKLESADQWNIETLPARLARQRIDPWKDYWKTRQGLDAALAKLKG
ncbi:MAG TPA: DNA ligase D [Usitatibacter sp.]|nr:DNA ligase D [Usitatibacter sp.]